MEFYLYDVDWTTLFGIEQSLLSIFLRGTAIFIFLFFVFRIFRREMGAIGISDVLVIVLVANASESGLTGGGKSITESMLLIATIVVWDRFVDNLEYRVPFLAPLFRPRPLSLIENGVMNRRNMRRELVTEDELNSQLRQQGIDDIKEVEKCLMEGDGSISIIKKTDDEAGASEGGGQKHQKKLAG